jgi:hypothetical protein
MSQSVIEQESADSPSRRYATLCICAGVAFIVLQLAARPFLSTYWDQRQEVKLVAWAVGIVVLLLLLAVGGGFLNRWGSAPVAEDDPSRINHRKAVGFGFWSTSAALILYCAVPTYCTVQEISYLLVSVVTVDSLLLFALLELGKTRDERA